MKNIIEEQLKIELNNRMIRFLELPTWRKMVHIKSVFGLEGMKQSELEKLLLNIKTHMELSLARNFGTTPRQVYQEIFDSNNADRKFLKYRNCPRFSRRFK